MDIASQASNSLPAVDKSNPASSVVTNDDQHFLLSFIMGTYFGPDLKGDRPQKSALQRRVEGLPPYTSDQLDGSHMKVAEVERVYYYVLRKADQSSVVKLPLLHQFFQGNLPTQGCDPHAYHPQFTSLFPPSLHPHSLSENKDKIIENIVFIEDPDIRYIKAEDVRRFKRLTRLEDFLLDRYSARFYTSVEHGMLYDVVVQETAQYNAWSPDIGFSPSSRKRCIDDILESEDQYIPDLSPLNSVDLSPLNSVPHQGTPARSTSTLPTEDDTNPMGRDGPAIIYLPSPPSKQELGNILATSNRGVALSGSAASGQMGHILGLVDIGESDDSYLFRVSLPGVIKNDDDFTCAIHPDGKVVLKGVTTTGERAVYRYSQVFEMQTHYLCPPGEFSLSFQLPGPVIIDTFTGNFGYDGILEGTVIKGLDTSE